MVAHTHLKPHAKMRCLYTDESYQAALTDLTAHRGYRLRCASVEQERLESQVFLNLGTSGSWWGHPLGVTHVTPSPDRIVVHLDTHTYVHSGLPIDLASHVLAHLLPCAHEGQIHGVNGLRIGASNGRDLELRWADADGRVTLRAGKGTDWGALLDAHARAAAGPDSVPVWQSRTLSDYEARARKPQRRVSIFQIERDLSWLGSAILRRVGLFATTSDAYSTSAWITGDEWKFELDTVPEVTIDHDRFLARLTDPIWGVPLRIVRHHCDCVAAAAQGRESYQCTYFLGHRGGLPGTMQIRFRSIEPLDREELWETFAATGAEMNWLARVLPAQADFADRSDDGSREEGGS